MARYMLKANFLHSVIATDFANGNNITRHSKTQFEEILPYIIFGKHFVDCCILIFDGLVGYDIW